MVFNPHIGVIDFSYGGDARFDLVHKPLSVSLDSITIIIPSSEELIKKIIQIKKDKSSETADSGVGFRIGKSKE
jgi:hypothetical protein